MRNEMVELKLLIDKFDDNFKYYKDSKNSYNEHSCRIEYIDPFLKLLGWDVSNEKGLAPQYREVIAENYSNKTDRPDYTLTLRGVSKIFVEAKKPAVDILNSPLPAIQCRKYGWNAKHNVAILTNFEYFILYDTSFIPNVNDNSTIARYKVYNYKEYLEKFDEILQIISRDAVYSGNYENLMDTHFKRNDSHKQQVDSLFLKQINEWRIALSNELYNKNEKYKSVDYLNDVVQSFINKIVFLRICEDRNLPVYYKLQETIDNPKDLQMKLEELFRVADKKYNSGIFSSENIIFDLNSTVIIDMIEGLYYPKSPYMFNIIEPNLLGKIYELFLTEHLIIGENQQIILTQKKDCINRSVVTTPTEIVKYMVEKTLSKVCEGKTPKQILNLKFADIACGSGVFLEEIFSYIQQYCIDWYTKNDIDYLIDMGSGTYKLPLNEKKQILCSCVFGIDIDIHAVEVSKFSLLIKLIEDETAPSVEGIVPILPDLAKNIFFGNALIDFEDIKQVELSTDELTSIVPFDWSVLGIEPFDAILGNPPYVSTEDMHSLLIPIEFKLYKKKFKSAYKQFDKYFVFLEHALSKVNNGGYINYIIPNKFFKIGSGEKLRELLVSEKNLVSIDDFGDTQLFEDKTIYSSIVLLQNKEQSEFSYSYVNSVENLWIGNNNDSIKMQMAMLDKFPWKLTTDIEFLTMLINLNKVAVPFENNANIFNGIQTSAERPVPIYWFSRDEIVNETDTIYEIKRDATLFKIEKSILRPYFKPTKKSEKGLNSYSSLATDKYIIFPYDSKGKLIPIEVMKLKYPFTFEYLIHYYERLVPNCVSDKGTRDVPNATEETWYQYGRTQALTVFTNTPKLIVGILSKDAMYAYDNKDMLIASGGTAGYCAISRKQGSEYELEYLQAWLSHPITEKIMQIIGSDFENGFYARGTAVISTLPFVELDFSIASQKNLYDKIVKLTREIYDINETLEINAIRSTNQVLIRKKENIIKEIEQLIEVVYNLKF